MKIPASFIEEIKSRLRVSELVARSVNLRRHGHEFMGLCPFHKEKTPSFTVNDEKGFFHCFGCGAHGDIISFIMQNESLGYMESLERAASLAGLAMPQFSREEIAREAKVESQQQIIEAVCAWFEAQLELPEGRIGRDYIASRGLSGDTVTRFRIGYAPDNRDSLTRAMREKNISEAQLIEAGVLISVDNKTPYARFRRRLIFPIRDRKSRVVAFGGRILPGEPNDKAPKYLNSPETALFHKGRMFYNYDLARKAAIDAGKLIVCEGYMDVIALAQAGYPQAVAPLGTAITAEQLQLAWQTVDEPTLCLDGDTAGGRAMLRAAHLALPLLNPGKSLRFARLPQGDDPDSMLRRGEAQRFEEALTMAQPLAQIIWRDVVKTTADTPEMKAAQEEALMRQAEQIKHPTVKQYYRGYFREQLWAQKQQNTRKNTGKHTHDKNNAGIELHVSAPETRHLSELFLALALRDPSLLADGSAEEWFLQLQVEPALKPLYTSMMQIILQEPSVSSQALLHALAEEHHAACEQVLGNAAKQGLKQTQDTVQTQLLVRHWWPFLLNKYALLQIMSECSEAEAALATEMHAENEQRLHHLKSQKQTLEREIARFYFEDPFE